MEFLSIQRILTAIVVGLLLVACQDNDLSEAEKAYTGAWVREIAPSPNGNRNFSYLELQPDRTGLTGVTIKTHTETFLSLTFKVTN